VPENVSRTENLHDRIDVALFAHPQGPTGQGLVAKREDGWDGFEFICHAKARDTWDRIVELVFSMRWISIFIKNTSVLILFQDDFGIISGWFRDYFRMISGLFQDDSGIISGWFGIVSGLFQDDFGMISGRLRKKCGPRAYFKTFCGLVREHHSLPLLSHVSLVFALHITPRKREKYVPEHWEGARHLADRPYFRANDFLARGGDAA
jgi:hypothetical protein